MRFPVGRQALLRDFYWSLRLGARSALIALFFAFPALVAAEDTANHDSATDFALSPQLIAQTSKEPAASTDFTAILTVPLLWTNNAIGAVGENGATGKPDAHIGPDFLIRWRHQFDFVRVTASADVSLDRYLNDKTLSGDTLGGTFNIALTDGKSDLFVPYAAYIAMADYEPGFSPRDDMFNSFLLGFTSRIGLSVTGAVIPFRKSANVGDWSIAIDVSGGRRLAAPFVYDNVFATILGDIVYNLTDDIHLGLLSKVRWRDYPNYFGVNRRDTFLALQARAEFTPDWLTKRVPGAEIDLSVEYQRNLSNLPTVRYSRWELGPTLTLTRHF